MLAVPNLSEGRDFAVLDRLRDSLGTEVELLDMHADLDHNRAVFTVAGSPAGLERSMLALAGAAAVEIEMPEWVGQHPAIGALDVCPVVWTTGRDRGPAEECARSIATGIGELGIPVFLYGDLAGDPERRERAWFRSGGLDRLWERMVSGELAPDCGPVRPHPKAGATLVTARPPLAAFNLELDNDDLDAAKAIAAGIREGGGPNAVPGVRAIGLELSTGRAQVSLNVHDPASLPLARVVAVARELAAGTGAAIAAAELVGLVPEKALDGYPADLPIRDFDPELRVIERRLRTS